MTTFPLVSLSLALLSFSVGAQQVYVVDAFNGAGAHFTDLPPALAAVNHGDTIMVRPGNYNPGTVDKGITMVPAKSMWPEIQTTPQQPMVIQNIPAGETFRMAGFSRWSAGAAGGYPFFVRVTNCSGEVYLQDLSPTEPTLSYPAMPTVEITDCAYVGMNNCTAYASQGDAVRVTRSTVSMTNCQLGELASIPCGGGVFADSSTLYITEPLINSSYTSSPAIDLVNSVLTLTGTSNAYVQGGYDVIGGTMAQSQPAIAAQGGQIFIDPALPLNPFKTGPSTIVGTATVTTKTIPGVFTRYSRLGGSLQVNHTAAPGAPMFAGISLAQAPAASPFGPLWLDLNTTLLYASGTVCHCNEQFSANIPLPLTIPPGTMVSLQGLALINGQLSLTTGCAQILY